MIMTSLEYSWVNWRDWFVTKVKEKFAVKKRHQHTPQQTPPAPCIYLVPRKQSVAFQEMLNLLLVRTSIYHFLLIILTSDYIKVEKTQSLASSPGWCCSGGRGQVTGSGGIVEEASSISGLWSLLLIVVKLIRWFLIFSSFRKCIVKPWPHTLSP